MPNSIAVIPLFFLQRVFHVLYRLARPLLLMAAFSLALAPSSAFAQAYTAYDCISTLHQVTGFTRLGLFAAPDANPVLEVAANYVGMRQGFEVVTPGGEVDLTKPANCREALDFLFFEGIDALLLDDSRCFAPGSAEFEDLLRGMEQLGILALSAYGPDHVRQGALLGPAVPIEPGGRLEFRAPIEQTSGQTGGQTSGRSGAAWSGAVEIFVPLAYNKTVAHRLQFPPSMDLLLAAEIHIE